jgi:hypothetical protein
MINPFMLLAAKTKPTPEEVTDIALRNLIWLDLLKENKADDAICGQITRNLVITQIIAADKQSRALYDMSCIGIKSFLKAMERKDDRDMKYMELSTDEFKAVKKVLISFGRILPQLDLGTIKGATDRWLEIKHVFGGRDDE